MTDFQAKEDFYIKKQIMKYIFTLMMLLPASILAEQAVINDYHDARDNYFYDKLYIEEVGESLYWGEARPISVGGGRSLEHVMPADWIAHHFGSVKLQ